MNQSRRTLLTASASAVALSAVSYQRVLGANEKLALGLIGSGGRGRSLILEAQKQGQNCVALCDVAPFRMEATTAALHKASGKLSLWGVGLGERPKLYADHRKLLEHKKLDGVIIATPDHWHHDVLLDAMAANKDTYIEKPLSKTIDEGRSMIAAVRKTKCVVQVGNQRHSGEHWKRCRDVIQSKDFGEDRKSVV